MNKLLYSTALLSTLSATAIVIIVTYWLNFPYKIVEWKTERYPVVNKIVKQGGEINFVSEYCKYMDIRPIISRLFEDGIVYYTPSSYGSTGVGCVKNTVSVDVPKNLPTGKYTLKSVYTYKVNPVRDITLTHSTEEFTVIK